MRVWFLQVVNKVVTVIDEKVLAFFHNSYCCLLKYIQISDFLNDSISKSI